MKQFVDVARSSKAYWSKVPLREEAPKYEVIANAYKPGGSLNRTAVTSFCNILADPFLPVGIMVAGPSFNDDLTSSCVCCNGKGKCKDNSVLENALAKAGRKGVSDAKDRRKV